MLDFLWKSIIRPPRKAYSPSELGAEVFLLGSRTYKREDFELICPHGFVMKCSYFDSLLDMRSRKPCVVYLHGNSSSRLESFQVIEQVLTMGMSLMAFDFPGCGLSEGEWLSLGFFEREDTERVIQYLVKNKKIERVFLWGRSMGGSIGVMLSENKSSMIAGIVADSPYCNLKRVCFELGEKKSRFVRYVFEWAWKFMRENVLKAYKFNIDDLDILSYAKKGSVPILLICSKDDEIIRFEHSKDIYNAYGSGEKEIMVISGSHNLVRDRFLVKVGADFIWGLNQKAKEKESIRAYRSLKRVSR